ncbi:MAG TPA: hypothetical protein VL992_03465 [Tepidisphaeraceae bacterium]|nr:hypothetical protein [Tepidisphaeraceae bacterium]
MNYETGEMLKPATRFKMMLADVLSIGTVVGGLLLFIRLKKKSPLIALTALDAFVFMIPVVGIALVFFVLLVTLFVVSAVFQLAAAFDITVAQIFFVIMPRAVYLLLAAIVLIRGIALFGGRCLQYPLPSAATRDRIRSVVFSFCPPDEVRHLRQFSIANAVRS